MSIAKSLAISEIALTRHALQFVLFLSIALAVPLAMAHPVAQGAMKILVHQNHIEIDATVSLEEVLVASTQGRKNQQVNIEILRDHGNYLLNHLSLSADDQLVSGQVLEIPRQSTGSLTYRFVYPMGKIAKKRIELKQTVLREIPFAPGNAWEAGYIVQIGMAGVSSPSGEGRLFTYREPLIFDADTATTNRPALFLDFVRHGIAHILDGYDHLLFVGALVLTIVGLRELVYVIAVFTLAHTLTLTLTVLGLVRLSANIVEPVIAASIAVTALQNLFNRYRQFNPARLTLVFSFGLFHGLGFAGGLSQAMAGMPGTNLALAVIAFSFGVELGHLLVVLPVFWGRVLIVKTEALNAAFLNSAQWYGSALILLGGLAFFYAAIR